MPVPFDEENPTLQPAEKQSVSREKPLTRWEVPVMVKLPTDHANLGLWILEDGGIAS